MQRVNRACVSTEGKILGEIGKGWVILVAVSHDDGPTDISYIVDKSINLRLFPDDQGKFNRSVLDVGGGILVVSQFTLMGDCRKGRRPSFTNSAPPDVARPLYESLVEAFRQKISHVQTGEFQANMQIDLTNDGPVTVIIDSTKKI